MTYNIVHSQPLYRHYRASSCSCATIVKICLSIVKIVLPLIIIFCTQGLWIKYATFRETPKVAFEGKYLLLFESNGTYAFSSPFPILNAMDVEHLRIGRVESAEEDIDDDGKPNTITVSIAVDLDKNFTLQSFTYFIFARYRLSYNTDVDVRINKSGRLISKLNVRGQMEVALTDRISLQTPLSGYAISGALKADLLAPFNGAIREEGIIRPQSTNPKHYSLPGIQERIRRQMINTRLQRSSWYTTSSMTSSFTLSLSVDIPEDEFTYRTDFFQLIKWAWIQYLAIFLIVNYFIQNILNYLYENNVLAAIPVVLKQGYTNH